MSARDDVTELIDWILARGCDSDDLGVILAGVIERLIVIGVRLPGCI